MFHRVLKATLVAVVFGALAQVEADNHESMVESVVIDGTDLKNSAGYAVSMNQEGDMVAIGEPNAAYAPTNKRLGLVRVFRKTCIVADQCTWTQMGQTIKSDPSTNEQRMRFGDSIKLCSDGYSLMVGAPQKDVGDSSSNHGEVFVYMWVQSINRWMMKGNSIQGAAKVNLGRSTSISASGNRIAVGIPNSNSNGVRSGEVVVYDYNDVTASWDVVHDAIPGSNAKDFVGFALDLSCDGTTLAMGGYKADKSKGQIRVFRWTEAGWVQLGADFDGESGDNLGKDVSLNEDGTILAIGASKDDADATDSGSVCVYHWDGVAWTLMDKLLGGQNAHDEFGLGVELSSDGKRLAVSSPMNDDADSNAGQVTVYAWQKNKWEQYGKPLNGVAPGGKFGFGLALSGDGKHVSVGVPNFNANAGRVQVFDVNEAYDACFAIECVKNCWKPRPENGCGWSTTQAGCRLGAYTTPEEVVTGVGSTCGDGSACSETGCMNGWKKFDGTRLVNTKNHKIGDRAVVTNPVECTTLCENQAGCVAVESLTLAVDSTLTPTKARCIFKSASSYDVGIQIPFTYNQNKKPWVLWERCTACTL